MSGRSTIVAASAAVLLLAVLVTLLATRRSDAPPDRPPEPSLPAPTPVPGPEPSPVDPGAGEDPVENEVAPERLCILLGLVVEGSTGDPVAGVTVESGGAKVVTGPDGRFTLPGVDEKTVLRLSAPWHVPVKARVGEAPPGETIERKYTLAAAGRVSGLVLGADGDPAEGAWVHVDWRLAARAYCPMPIPIAPAVQTDAEGRFALTVRAPASGVRVFAAMEGATAGASGAFELRAREEESEVVVRLGRRSAIIVTVATEDGAALEQVQAHLVAEKGDPWAPLDGLPRAYMGDGARLPPEFTLEGFTGRPFTIHVCAEGFSPKALPSNEVLPAAGLPFRRVQVVLERGLFVSGTLLDAEGRPVENAVIHANRGRAHMRKQIPFSCLHARTDAQGKFRVGGLGKLEYEVHATVGSRRSNSVTNVPGGAENVELRLE